MIKAAQGVYEPLAQAAAELQSRIYNIVETGWVEIVEREQRASGELMFSWQPTRHAEARDPYVLGYAAFAARYPDDEGFRQWFTSIDTGIERVSSGDHRRLIDIHRALVALIPALDPKHKYTSGYALEPISPASTESR